MTTPPPNLLQTAKSNIEARTNPNDQTPTRRRRFSFGFLRIGEWNRDFVSDFQVRICLCLVAWLAMGTASFAADNIGILGSEPKWEVLRAYQHTITRDEFAHLLNDVYCTHGIPDDLIKLDADSVEVVTKRDSRQTFTLEFAPDETSKVRIPRLWRPAKSLPPTKEDKPLAGLRIALDPGHLGGHWAKMEERWFQVGNTKAVTEGDLTLRVSRLLAARLRKLGATVLFVRNSTKPVTTKRPADFKELARNILIKNGVPRPRDEVLNPKDPEKEGTIKFQSEILFYR